MLYNMFLIYLLIISKLSANFNNRGILLVYFNTDKFFRGRYFS